MIMVTYWNCPYLRCYFAIDSVALLHSWAVSYVGVTGLIVWALRFLDYDHAAYTSKTSFSLAALLSIATFLLSLQKRKRLERLNAKSAKKQVRQVGLRPVICNLNPRWAGYIALSRYCFCLGLGTAKTIWFVITVQILYLDGLVEQRVASMHSWPGGRTSTDVRSWVIL